MIVYVCAVLLLLFHQASHWLLIEESSWKKSLKKCVALCLFFPSKVSLKNCRPCQFYANPFVLHISVSNTRRLMVNPLELKFSDIIKAYSVFICTRMINIPAQRNLRLFSIRPLKLTSHWDVFVDRVLKTALKRIINETLKDTQTSAAE